MTNSTRHSEQPHQQQASGTAIPYRYRSVPVPGGGFVTGYVFHPTVPNILYCRTDIGGSYRYDFENDAWISLIDHATDPDAWETYPLSLALDRHNPSNIYAMVGRKPVSKIAFSDDYGANWIYFDAPVIDNAGNTAAIHGNAPGRSTGERLVVDPHDSNVLYMGTMADGLWKTTDRCRTWTRLAVCAPGGTPETNIAFVELDPSSGGDGRQTQRIIAATSGERNSPGGNVRGSSVYKSEDGGATWSPLAGEPAPVLGGPADYPGYVGQRAAFVGNRLFVSYAAYNIGWSRWDSYGCDTGGCYDGALFRYELDEQGAVVRADDITPPNYAAPDFRDSEAPDRRIGCGISGIGVDAQAPGTFICSTINSRQDTIYRSTDYGETWTPVLSGLEVGKLDFNVPYHRPENNGGGSLVHWMADVKINPFNRDMALFTTGAGIFMTKNLTAADRGETVVWAGANDGVEETVHLNIYSPPAGDVKLIDIIGDYGGFIFTDLDRPAPNTFANERGDRWITAMNADYPDRDPNYLVVTPRGNWTGRTKGGLILSRDQGRTWEQLPDPLGLTDEIDATVAELKKPNVTSGWTAVSADGSAIVWGLGKPVHASRYVYTFDEGRTWQQSQLFDLEGRPIEGTDVPFKVMADRVAGEIFYGLGVGSFFVSTDRGATFRQRPVPAGFPVVDLAGIDGWQHYEIRVESGREGVIWMAMVQDGLWRIVYDRAQDTFEGSRVSAAGDTIKRIGLGKPEEGSDVKTLFTSGTIGGVYGFWRSHDGGATWLRINDEKTQFGDIRSISGDPRVFGRIYVATGTRGVVYGDVIGEGQA